MKLAAILATCGVLTSGCARWGKVQSYGPPQEVGRRLVGEPQIQETTDFSAGFAADAYNGAGFAVGGVQASQRTHCVQQAEVDFVQPVSIAPHVEHRMRDVVGSMITGLVGLTILGAAAGQYAIAQSEYQSDLDLHQTDPSFFAQPTQPTPPTTAYWIGGAAVVGAAAWFLYSMAALPGGPTPQTETQALRYTTTMYVEASGCGLVPGDRPVATGN